MPADALKKYAKRHSIYASISANSARYSDCTVRAMKQFCIDKRITCDRYGRNKIDILRTIVDYWVVQKEQQPRQSHCTARLRDMTHPADTKLPHSLQYMERYPHEKLWYDLNFKLFNSQMSRVQFRCDCRSGSQLPSCCHHVAACLRLFWYTLCAEETLEQTLMKRSKRDIAIDNCMYDCTMYKQFQNDHPNEDGCICKEHKDEDTILCNSCGIWYHPTCVGTTWDDIMSSKYTYDEWWCRNCDINAVWTIRHN
eukprot:224758_1